MNQTVTRTVTNAKLNVIEYAPGDRSARFADAAIPCGVKVIGQVHGVHYVDDRGYNAGYAYIMRFADGTESQEFAREKDACHAIQAPAYPYHPSHDAIVTAAGGLALALLACLTGTPASAQSLPLVPTDGECVITRQFEDGSATALCGHDVWAYDADGGFIVDNGIKFVYRAEGTWYQVAR